MKIKKLISYSLYFFPPLLCLCYFFLPFAGIVWAEKKSYILTPFHLLISYLVAGGRNIPLPIPVYLFSFLTVGSILFAAYLLITRKNFRWYALSMLGSSLSSLGLLLSLMLLDGGNAEFSFVPLSSFFLLFLGGIAAGAFALSLWNHNKLSEYIFLFFASVAVISVALITGFMVFMGTPAISQIGLLQFLFGTQWAPTAASPSFGIGAMILTTVFATAGAILVGAPVGVLTGVFLAEMAPSRVASLLRSAINLLAGIPSVVFGFFGMLVIVPFLRDTFHVVGDSLLAVIIILSVMILPTVISITETSLRTVPGAMKEASLGLGATHIQTIFKILIPSARSGIFAGLILGVGRAIGETMAVIMVAGNVVNLPSLLSPVRPMTAGIVLEMAYAADLHRQALFAIGLVLFVFIMIVNLGFRAIMKKAGEKFEA